MNAQCTPMHGELLDSNSFFPPVAYSRVDDLLSEFTRKKSKINSFSETLIEEMSQVSSYFGSFYAKENNGSHPPSLSYLTNKEGAVKALEAEYWQQIINLTGVMDIMPESRRAELRNQISNYETIEFNRGNIESTVLTLLADRERFFAERVDGVFKSLSGEHVTNQPEGFSKRMIIDNVHNCYEYGSFGYTDYKKIGYLHDLRVIVRKFAGLTGEEANLNGTTSDLVEAACKVTGQWMSIDGGHIRLRVYKKGTAHVEISPEMAWKLNTVLSYLYPTAIPPKFRQKPKKQRKEFKLMERPLPSAVVAELSKLDISYNSIKVHSYRIDKQTEKELHAALEQIGGVITRRPEKDFYYYVFDFDYDVNPVIEEIIKTGEIPHYKSYQFYPTPESIAKDAVEMAEIGEHDQCLEPSAGIGGLADFMPKDRTLCVEISELHSKILKEKGFKVITGDFLKLADETNKRFDRIVMNPPFSEGRWKAHLDAACKLLNKNGKLIAILPSSAKGKELVKGFKHTYSNEYNGEFKSTSISVVILKLE